MKKLLLPLFLSLSLFCSTAEANQFPLTPILETCTCANSTSALCQGSKWATDGTNNDASGVTSNTCYDPTSSNGEEDYWNTPFYGILEGYATLNTLPAFPSNNGFYIVFAPDKTSGTGYYIGMYRTTSIDVYRAAGYGSYTDILDITKTPSAGDSIGATYNIYTGLITVWYKSGSGAWTPIGSVIDTTYENSIYFGILLQEGTGRYSNIGGGTEPSVFVTNNFNTSGNVVLP